MKVLAVGAQKGGVGKTTSSLYLAARAAELLGGSRVRPAIGLIDRDESRNLTVLAEMRPEVLAPGVILLPGPELPLAASALELIIIDTPPGLSAIDSLKESNMVIIPVLPEEQGINNFAAYLHSIDRYRVMQAPTMRLVAVLPTMVETRRLAHKTFLPVIGDLAREHRPPLAVLTPVPRRSAVGDIILSAPYYDAPAKELWDYAGIAPVTI